MGLLDGDTLKEQLQYHDIRRLIAARMYVNDLDVEKIKAELALREGTAFQKALRDVERVRSALKVSTPARRSVKPTQAELERLWKAQRAYRHKMLIP